MHNNSLACDIQETRISLLEVGSTILCSFMGPDDHKMLMGSKIDTRQQAWNAFFFHFYGHYDHQCIIFFLLLRLMRVLMTIF